MSVWVKATGSPGGAKMYVKDSGTWKPVCEGGLTGIGGWAEITAVTGSPKRYDYTDADGTDWIAFEWTGDGTVTTTEGLVDSLVVGHGSQGVDAQNSPPGHGPGSNVQNGPQFLTATAHPIHLAPAGGQESWLDTRAARDCYGWNVGAGGMSLTPQTSAGVTLNYNGTAIQYGASGELSLTTPGSGGNKSGSRPGIAGVVIVRVPAANVTATGGWV